MRNGMSFLVKRVFLNKFKDVPTGLCYSFSVGLEDFSISSTFPLLITTNQANIMITLSPNTLQKSNLIVCLLVTPRIWPNVFLVTIEQRQ
jgi:hypothetical protein